MGNPKINTSTTDNYSPPPDRSAEVGILPLVPGDYVAAGSRGFPAAKQGEQDTRMAVLDVPELGRVQITYRLTSHRHYRNQLWSWRAVRADQITAVPK